MAAESFTILRDPAGCAEITLHQKNQTDDSRVDVGPADDKRDALWPHLFQRAIIENAAGRTTEMISAPPALVIA
jgi:hypothetical protein